jgi:group II intron reverse transcriptase/maturase
MEQRNSIKDVKGKAQVGQTPTRLNTEDLIEGGLNRSSEEDSVMELERRVGIIQLELPFTTYRKGRRTKEVTTKGIPITKSMVWQAYKKVRKNKGSAGVDNQSLANYKANISDNLYKLWNRLTSGSYFPNPVKEVEIPKKDGSMRKLGIPTVEDRIAQQVLKEYLESRFEAEFHPNSYGYRPLKSAHQALESVRQNVRKTDWVIDMDIKGFFDEVSHDLLKKALAVHVDESWVKMYIERWLTSPIQTSSKELRYRQGKGTPQGGVISPLLANIFLHYVFDKWMTIYYPDLAFVRYADDIIVHCRTKEESEEVLRSIKERMSVCQLELHKEKTKIVFCKKYKKRAKHPIVKFDFLGFSFQPRPTALKTGKMFLGYDCAISNSSEKKIIEEIRTTNFHRWTNRSIEEIASFFNPKIRGWIRYFGKFRRHKLYRLFRRFNFRLIKWASKRYKRFKGSHTKAGKWLRRMIVESPQLFVNWQMGFKDA